LQGGVPPVSGAAEKPQKQAIFIGGTPGTPDTPYFNYMFLTKT
jgi:hypothetical protein